MDVLTMARAKELAQEVVNEFGEDYVYPEEQKRHNPTLGYDQCTYVHDGKPSCLVAQILHRHGVSLEDMSRMEFDSGGELARRFANPAHRVDEYLNSLQGKQDEGLAWGYAVAWGNMYYAK